MMPAQLQAVLISAVYGVWALAYNGLCLLYNFNVVVNKDAFDVRVRLPKLTFMEVICMQLCSIILTFREIADAWRWPHLPHALMEAILGFHVVILLAFYPRRCFQVLMVYDSNWRKSYYNNFLLIHRLFLIWSILVWAVTVLPLWLGSRACLKMYVCCFMPSTCMCFLKAITNY